MKTVINVLFFSLLTTVMFAQKTTMKQGKLSATSTKTSKINPAASPQCIFQRHIETHLCKPQQSKLTPQSLTYASQIVIGIGAGSIPNGHCPNLGSQVGWTSFNIETEIFINFYGIKVVIPGTQKNQNDIATSNLYSITGSNLDFYALPANLVGTVSPTYPSRKSFMLRVKITGKNGAVTSNYTTEYEMEVTRDAGQACVSVIQQVKGPK